MAKVLHVLKIAMMVVAIVVISMAALGWLYLIRRPLGAAGPPIGEALPLDQLAGRAGVALGPFALVWAAAGALLGLIARACGVGRLTAVSLIGLGVGASLFAATGMSIVFTQQIPASQAFSAAAHVHAVYLAGGLAGGGAALVALAYDGFVVIAHVATR